MHYEFVDHDLLTEMERTAYGNGDTTTAQLLGKLIEAQDMIEGLRQELRQDQEDSEVVRQELRQDQEDSEVVRQDLRDEIKDLRADFKTIRTALTELQRLTDGY